MDVIFAPQVLISIFIGRMLIKKIFWDFEIETLIGTVVYFLYLVSGRAARGLWGFGARSWQASRNIQVALPQRKHSVTSVLDINSVFRLKGLEAILGLDDRRHEIRIDLERGHTIIAGMTGWGKTIMLNGLIAQLVTRPYFKQEYDLYLLDLKSSKYDYLSLWKPVVAGYYSIDEYGSSDQAIEALEHIAETMHRQSSNRKIVVIIDELAMLTSQAPDPKVRQRGRALLQRLAAQIRDRGTIISATQRVHYEVIDRMVAANMDRKICLHVDDNNDAKLVLRFKPTVDCTELKHGEFVLKEPGAKNREIIGRTIMMKLPEEIDLAVASLIDITADSDDRVKIFKLAASTLNSGDTLPGVRKDFWKLAGFNIETVRTAYKNFANAGAVTADVDKRGQPNRYLLNGDFGDCYKKVIEYIQAGKWESAPETIGRSNGEEE